MVVELALLGVVVVDAREELLVEVGPFLEGEAFAEDARRDVARDECGLYGDCSRSAHGVDEVGVTLPSRHENHASCEDLVEGSLDTLLSVAAAVQGVAAGVEGQCGIVAGDMDMQADVRIGEGDVGSLSRALAELVHDGVLDLIGDEVGVAELVTVDDGVHGEGLSLGDIGAPVQVFHIIIYVVGGGSLEMLDGFKDTYGRVQLEVGTIHHFLVSGERDHTAANLNVVGAKLSELLS